MPLGTSGLPFPVRMVPRMQKGMAWVSMGAESKNRERDHIGRRSGIVQRAVSGGSGDGDFLQRMAAGGGAADVDEQSRSGSGGEAAGADCLWRDGARGAELGMLSCDCAFAAGTGERRNFAGAIGKAGRGFSDA